MLLSNTLRSERNYLDDDQGRQFVLDNPGLFPELVVANPDFFPPKRVQAATRLLKRRQARESVELEPVPVEEVAGLIPDTTADDRSGPTFDPLSEEVAFALEHPLLVPEVVNRLPERFDEDTVIMARQELARPGYQRKVGHHLLSYIRSIMRLSTRRGQAVN